MVAPHLIFGRKGERSAKKLLKSKGYRILDSNWSAREGELDLVCEKRGTLVFVEVKSRGQGAMGSPAQALTPTKIGRLAKAASLYLSEKDLWHMPCRFDLVAVSKTDGQEHLEHLEDVVDCAQAFGGGHSHWQPW